MKSPSISSINCLSLYLQNLVLDKRLILLDKNSVLYLYRYPAPFPAPAIVTYFRPNFAPSSKFWIGTSTRPRASEGSKRQRHRSVYP